MSADDKRSDGDERTRTSRCAAVAGMIALAAVIILAQAPANAEDQFESLRLQRLQAPEETAPEPATPAPAPVRRHPTPQRRVIHEASVEVGPSDEIWTVSAGGELRKTMAEWCARHGWSLEWKPEYTYDITTSARFSGRFEDAVKALFASMADVRPMPTAKLYPMNKVLVVSNMGAGVAD